MASLQGQLADFALQAYRSNPNFIEGIIAKGEGALKAFIVGVFANVKVGGLAGIVLPEVEGGIERFADAYISAHAPGEIYADIGALLANEAKALGG